MFIEFIIHLNEDSELFSFFSFSKFNISKNNLLKSNYE